MKAKPNHFLILLLLLTGNIGTQANEIFLKKANNNLISGNIENSKVDLADCPVDVTNNSISTNDPLTLCGEGSVSFTGSTPDITLAADTSLQWQQRTTSGPWENILDATGLHYTTGSLNQTTFFRRLVVIAGCNDFPTSEIEVTVNPIPTAPTNGIQAEICFGDENTAISASVLSSETIDWYVVPSGGTALLVDNTSYTSTEIEAGVYTYYAEARNATTNCVSSSRLAVDYTIKDSPTLSLTSATCSDDLLTYTIVFVSNGEVSSTAGIVDNTAKTITGITAGTEVTLTAISTNGCTTNIVVTAPDCSCPQVATPTNGIPAEICYGDKNIAISASVEADETIDWYAEATGGIPLTTGSLIYTSTEETAGVYTYYAEARNTTTDCVSSSRLAVAYTIKANPTLGLSGTTCSGDLLTYNIEFTSNGTVNSSEGTVDNTAKTVTGIPAGTDVTLTATLVGCTTDLLVTAPDCSCPAVAVPTNGNPAEICFGDPSTPISASAEAGETIDWYADATGGTALATGSLSYTSTEDAVGVYTYYAEARNTTTDCVSSSRLAVTYTIKANPTLGLSETTCSEDLLTYNIEFTSNGTVNSSEGTVDNSAKTVTGIPAGTDVTLTATLDGCTTDLLVTAPDCSCPAVAIPTNGNPAEICFGDPSTPISASAEAGETIDWYADATGGTALATGSLSFTSTEDASGIYTYYAEARNTTTNCVSSSRLAVTYTIKANPTLGLTSATCSEDLQTYNIIFTSNGTVTSTSGTVDNTAKTVTGIPAGTDVTLTATLDDCTTDLLVTAPDCSCPAVTIPTNGNPAEICFGDPSTPISASAEAGETIDWYADATGGTALATGSLSFTSTEDAVGVYTYYAEARNTTTNCVSSSRLAVTYTIKANPTLGLTSATCSEDLQTYNIIFTSNGTITSTSGTVNNATKTVTGITSGTAVTLTATLDGCTTELEVVAPDCSCPDIAAPTLGVPSEICYGDINTAISASVKTGETIDWYTDATGGTPLTSGSLSYTSAEEAVGVYTYYAEARNTTTSCVSSTRLAVNYTIKENPTLSLISATCSEDLQTYDIVFASNGTVTSTSGTVNNTAKTVTGITSGTAVTLTASLNGCTTDLGINAPDCSCPAVAAPTLGVSSEICFGDENIAISASVEEDETIDWYANATGGTPLVSGSLSYTSIETDPGLYTYYAETRNTTTNCVSSTRLAVTARIIAKPVITNISENNPTICQGLGILDFTFTGIPNGTYSIVSDDTTFSNVMITDNSATVIAPAGIYNNLIITADGCTSANGVSASLSDPNPPPPPTVTVQDNCGESVLTATNYTGLLTWSTGESTQSITVTDPGSYAVTQTVNGCISNTAFIIVSPKTIPTIASVTETDPTVCQGQGTLDFIFTDVPNGSYTIAYDGNRFSEVDVSGNRAAVQASAGMYNNLRISVNGCSSAYGVNANLSDPNPPPTPTITVEDKCGESILTASNYTGTLLWSTGETAESISVTEVGNYSLTQNVNGCTSNAASAIASPTTSSLQPDIDITNSCGESKITVNNLTENAWLYWQINNKLDSIQDDNFTVNEEGVYIIYQKLGNCASSNATVTVTPLTVPSAPIGNDKEICATTIVQPLIAEATTEESNTEIFWYDEPSGGNEILMPILENIGAVTYYAEAQNTVTGCTSDSRTPVTLTIKPNPKETLIDTTIIGKPQANVAVLIFPNDSLQYQWYLNNTEINDAKKQYYYLNESERQAGNTFTIEVELQNGCKAKFNYSYANNIPDNAINAFKSSELSDTDNLILIYPNPANNNLNIAVNTKQLKEKQALHAKIYSVTGACIIETTLDENPKSIDTRYLRPGFYSVAIFNAQKRLSTKKLIVTKL